MLVQLLALRASALIANNLAADWKGGVGVTASGGRISQWNDQHTLMNNDGITNNLTQANASFQPIDWVDAHGFHGVMFPWGFSSSHPDDYLNIPSSLTVNTTNLTIYVVATGPTDQERSETLVWFSGSSEWIKFFLAGAFPSYFPASLSVGSRTSTIYPPLNRAVVVASSDNLKTTFRWNYVVQTNAPQATATLNGGGTIGVNNSAIGSGTEWGYSGIVYRILVYKNAHTAAQMDAQVAELASLYGVLTNYTKQVVCRGDSIIEGQGSTLLQTLPFQLWERYPEILWRNQGIGSTLIGTNGDSNGSMYQTDGNFVDPLYDPSLQQNWIFFFGGVNDMGAGVSATSAFGRLTNYIAARKAAHPWKFYPTTVQARTAAALNQSNMVFNACIRTNVANWAGFIDPGLNSPIETRLNNPTNLTYYFTDGLHLTNAGYGVFADHFGQIINVPHRSTGFLAP